MNSYIHLLIRKSNCRTRLAAGFHPPPHSQKCVCVYHLSAGEVVVEQRVYGTDVLLTTKYTVCWWENHVPDPLDRTSLLASGCWQSKDQSSDIMRIIWQCPNTRKIWRSVTNDTEIVWDNVPSWVRVLFAAWLFGYTQDRKVLSSSSSFFCCLNYGLRLPLFVQRKWSIEGRKLLVCVCWKYWHFDMAKIAS